MKEIKNNIKKGGDIKKEITKYFFMFGAITGSIYFWLVISKLVNTTESENWLIPIIIFGVIFIFWSLAILLENIRWRFFLFGGILIFVGAIFTQSIFFIVTAILAIEILYLGTIWVHESMEARIRLNIWMSLRLGRRLFVVAMTLVVVGGFLMPVLLSGEERVLPLINIGEKQAKLISKVISIFDSNLDAKKSAEMTVDEYILEQQTKFNDGSENILGDNNIPERFAIIERQTILTAGRESISKLVERNINGNEKIMNIFVEIINNKINNYFNTEVSQVSGFVPLLFSALSFFVMFSIGSFITSFLTFFVAAIFKLLLLTKLVKLGTKEVQVEIIK